MAFYGARRSGCDVVHGESYTPALTSTWYHVLEAFGSTGNLFLLIPGSEAAGPGLRLPSRAFFIPYFFDRFKILGKALWFCETRMFYFRCKETEGTSFAGCVPDP